MIDRTEARFWRKVSKSEDPDGCWVWTAARDSYGYGVCSPTPRNSSTRAHRAIWQILFGEIPEGYFVCHKCDNPPCCAPHHLFLGTPKDNMQDKSDKGRAYGQKKGEEHTQSILKESDVVRIFELNQDGLTCRDIGKLLDIGEWSVSLILRGKQWKHVETPFRDKVKDNTYFSDEEIVEIFRRYKQTGSMRRVAAEFGRDSGNIHMILTRKNYADVAIPDDVQVEIKSSTKLTAEDIPIIFKFYKEGLSMKEIADKYGLDVSNVGLILNRKSWKRVPISEDLLIEAKPPKTKLNPNLIIDIFKLAKEGVTHKDLAKLMCVHICTIKEILSRKVWKEVEIPAEYTYI